MCHSIFCFLSPKSQELISYYVIPPTSELLNLPCSALLSRSLGYPVSSIELLSSTVITHWQSAQCP